MATVMTGDPLDTENRAIASDGKDDSMNAPARLAASLREDSSDKFHSSRSRSRSPPAAELRAANLPPSDGERATGTSLAPTVSCYDAIDTSRWIAKWLSEKS